MQGYWKDLTGFRSVIEALREKKISLYMLDDIWHFAAVPLFGLSTYLHVFRLRRWGRRRCLYKARKEKNMRLMQLWWLNLKFLLCHQYPKMVTFTVLFSTHLMPISNCTLKINTWTPLSPAILKPPQFSFKIKWLMLSFQRSFYAGWPILVHSMVNK